MLTHQDFPVIRSQRLHKHLVHWWDLVTWSQKTLRETTEPVSQCKHLVSLRSNWLFRLSQDCQDVSLWSIRVWNRAKNKQLTVKLYLLSIFQAQLFSQLSTQLHFMTVLAGGGSIESPAEENWRSMAPGQLQSLVLKTDPQSYIVVLFDHLLNCCIITTLLCLPANCFFSFKSFTA